MKRILLLALLCAFLMSPSARADVLNGGTASWHSWVAPTQGSGAFWDNVSKDGQNCNVGFWVSGTGSCTAPITGFYKNSPGTGGSYLGEGADGFVMTRDLSTLVTATAGVGVSALSKTTEFGWFSTSDPDKTQHPLLNAGALGTTISFSVPSGDYGFYLHVVDPRKGAAVPDATFYSDTPDGYAGGKTHFAAFDLGNGRYAIGIEDKQGKDGDPNWSDYDYNDFVVLVESTPVPEPATLALLGGGLLGITALRRRSNRR